MIEKVSQQNKQIFSKEAQLYTSDLEKQILELDPRLSNFNQQIGQVCKTYRLLSDSARKANFYRQSPVFISVTNHFDDVIKVLDARPDLINQTLKELLIEVITLLRQIINEYCFETESNPNWIDLQNNLFTQINASLATKMQGFDDHTSSIISNQYNSNEINEQNIDSLNLPYNLNDAFDDLHSLDVKDSKIKRFDDFLSFNQIDQTESTDTFFSLQLGDLDKLRQDLDESRMEIFQSSLELKHDLSQVASDEITHIEFNQEVSAISEDFDTHFDNLINLRSQRLPMPELLKDIFPLTNTNDLLENEDETALQIGNMENGESDLDTHFDNLINLRSQRLPMPELLKNIFPLTNTNDLLENEDETTLQEGNRGSAEEELDNHWHQFEESQSLKELNTHNEDLLENHDESAKISSQTFSLSDDNRDLIDDIDDDIADSFFERFPLDDDEVAFWNSLESMNPLDFLENPQQVEKSEKLEDQSQNQISSLVDSSQVESGLLWQDILKSQDFSSSDVDTTIEESPIYQKRSIPSTADSALVDSHYQEIEFPALNGYTAIDNYLGDISPLSLKMTTDLKIDLHANEDSGIIKQLDTHLTNTDNHEANIRVPINFLEHWEDLSEELLVRKTNLDVYLSEILALSHKAQKQLQVFDPQVDDNQNAIVTLQNTLKLITCLLEHTEKQSYAMSHDVCNLRKNFRQALKFPISSLVSKFPRILHELSLEHGKQVELIVQGSGIGIEREIAVLVGDTLEILLRNAFEYSIETTSERHQVGKTLQGKIEINATQTDDQTIIKISDDGRGFDNQASNIFHSETIMNLSNIRKNLWDIGGSISIKSHSGQGNQVTVTLPITVSLLSVLLIEIDQMCLAIASKCIREVVPISEEETNINEEPQTLVWNNHVVPIVRLNSLLKINCQRNSYQKNVPFSTNQILSHRPAIALPSYLIIQHDHNLFALKTDGCWYEQEATFHQIKGDIALPTLFSGAVVLWNSQAVALINQAELVNQCLPSHPNFNVFDLQSAHTSFLDLQDNSPQQKNLKSLSDFFTFNDQSNDSDISEFLKNPVLPFSQTPEPENLESSGIFMSDLPDGQKRLSIQPKVLIVESSANVSRYLAMTLAKSGFLTEQVHDGKAANAFLKERLKDKLDIDIVITDLEMPQMDGFKLISSIRSDAELHNLPIVVLTARNNENDQKLALELGANAYFSKPYREQELIKTLQEIISR
ncbi:MAG: response regulator [Pseudanabaena sp.]